ncbi:ATP-binding protein [Ilumatobacter nonamiensis]|uniref:ATP-binding protein n=1 Tax=Ilumatobacter nonamiensis TaxID=467093 RepID=UPI0003481F4F|nr:histidine kinase [Ilumatobacter nonamiensis]
MIAPTRHVADRESPPSLGWAITVLVASWTLAAIAVALVPFTDPSWHTGQWYGLVDLSDAIVFGATSALLLARGRHPVGWLVALCAIGGGLAAVGFQWSMLVLAHPDVPEFATLQLAQNSAWLPGTYAMIMIAPVLVRRRPLHLIDRAFVALAAAVISGLTLIRLTDPFPWPDGASITPLAIESRWWLDTIERTTQAQFIVVCACASIAIIDLSRRWWRQSPDERRGLGWLTVGAALMAAAFLPLALPAPWTAGFPDWATPVLHLSSQLFFPAALLVAVLRQRIDGLEVLLGRTTLWMLLSGVLLAIYIGTVAIGGQLLPTDDGLVLAVATAAVAVSISPLRRVLQRRIDNLVRGDVSVPTEAFIGMGRRLGAATDDTELLTVIAESVVQALRLGGLAIEVDWPSGARRVASVGELSIASIETRDLVVSREVVGRVIVSGRRGELLDRHTLQSLDDLTPVVATVVQLVARTRELTESRARIAGARDEERRVLRRELHDGFGPSLAGVALGLRAAENLMGTDPAVAGPLVRRMADEIDERIEEVRTLARGLLPPVLEELGLVPAIVELAERYRDVGVLDVEVTARDVSVDADIRQAIYGIVAEAVRNVARHADATTCHVAVVDGDTGLTITVDDDGTGIPAVPVSGVGLRSMRERAEGIGASLTIEGGANGTRVRVVVPHDVSRAASMVGSEQ